MRRWPTAAEVRDWLLPPGGVLVILHETVLTDAERPLIIGVAAAMMGLPWALAEGLTRARGGDGRATGGGSPGRSGRSGSRSPR